MFCSNINAFYYCFCCFRRLLLLLLLYSLTYLLIYLFTYLLTYLLICLLIYLFAYLLTYLLICLLTYYLQKSFSVAKIEFPETFEVNGLPKVGGLLDMRLGTNDRNFRCATCSGSMNDCPGHFGHLELAKPVFHVGFLGKVKKILECVCFFCGKLKADKSSLRYAQARSLKEARARLNNVWNLCKSKMICDGSDGEQAIGCGHRQPIIRREGLRLYVSFKTSSASAADDSSAALSGSAADGKNYLSAEKVLAILKRISDEDCIAMGMQPAFSRPEWMILTTLPVPPPPVRPSIQMESMLRSEDDLTFKLADILRACQALRKHEADGSPAHIISEFEQLLQVRNDSLFDAVILLTLVPRRYLHG